MRAIRLAAIAVAVPCFALILESSILQVPTGTWQWTSNMSSARAMLGHSESPQSWVPKG